MANAYFFPVLESIMGIMAAAIHPMQAGYLEWQTPYMEKVLYEVLAGE